MVKKSKTDISLTEKLNNIIKRFNSRKTPKKLKSEEFESWIINYCYLLIEGAGDKKICLPPLVDLKDLYLIDSLQKGLDRDISTTYIHYVRETLVERGLLKKIIVKGNSNRNIKFEICHEYFTS